MLADLRWLVVVVAVGCSGRAATLAEGSATPAAKAVVAAPAPPPPAPVPAPPSCTAKRAHEDRDRIDSAQHDAFGDPLPEHAIARLGSVRMRHGQTIQQVAFCAGTVLAADRSEIVRAWDPVTGASRRRWSVGDEVVRLQCIAGVPHAVTRKGRDAALDLQTGGSEVLEIGPVADAIAVTRDDLRIVRQADLARVRCNETKPLVALAQDLFPVRLSPDGQHVAGGAGDDLVLFVELAKPPQKLAQASPIEALGWSTDSRRLLVAHKDHRVDVLAPDGTRERTIGPYPDGVQNNIIAVAASADLLVVGTYGGSLLRYEAATGRPLAPLQVVRDQMSGSVDAIAFSDDGSQLAIGGGDNQVRVLAARATTAPALDRPHGHQEAVWDATFSPDGMRIATASSDHTLRIWDAATGAQLASLAASGDEDVRPMISVAWPAGVLVASDDYNKYRRWNDRTFERGPLIKAPALWAYHFATSGDRTTLATATAKAWWLLDSKSLAVRSTGAPLPVASGVEVDSITIDRAGHRLGFCITGEPAQIEVVSSAGARLLKRALEDTSCPVVALSPDGATLATGLGELIAIGGAAPKTFSKEPVGALRFSADGKLLAGAVGLEIRIWEVATRNLVHTFRGHDGAIYSIAWSPTGDRIVSTSADLDALVWKL